MTKGIKVAVIAIVLLGVSVAAWQLSSKGATSASVETTPTANKTETVATPLPAGWLAAPPAFLTEWDSYQKLSETAQAHLKELVASEPVKNFQRENDEATGAAQRILAQCTPTNQPICIPVGYQFDIKARAFSPAPLTPAPTATQKK